MNGFVNGAILMLIGWFYLVVCVVRLIMEYEEWSQDQEMLIMAELLILTVNDEDGTSLFPYPFDDLVDIDDYMVSGPLDLATQAEWGVTNETPLKFAGG